MYREAQLSCPSCGAALALTEASLTAHRCDSCGGAWLGPEATVHLMQGADDTQDTELARVTHEAAAHAHAATPSNAPGRACPACGTELAPMAFAGVVVDTCAAHGTFFDRSEVEQVVVACRKLREQQAHENDPTFAGVAEDASTLVAGTAGIAARGAFQLVFNVLEALFTKSERERARDRYYGGIT